jgi:hypothetical protein
MFSRTNLTPVIEENSCAPTPLLHSAIPSFNNISDLSEFTPKDGQDDNSKGPSFMDTDFIAERNLL